MPPLPNAAQIIAQQLEKGKPIRTAMMAAGYGQHQANKGKAGIPAKIWREMSSTAKEMVRIGTQLTAADQENLVRGRLAMNTILGKDAGVMSAKALGSDKRVNMFASDQINTNIIITPALPGQKPTLLAETVGTPEPEK